MSRLKGDILEISQLSINQKNEMFNLFCLYFNRVERTQFDMDLQEKNWVIILKDYISGQIKGFSTQMIMESEVDGSVIKAIFSGDTIIHKDFWGESTLAKVWLNFVCSLARLYKETKLYWFLVAMGYKTYRFLPVYFKEFYPCYNKLTPEFEQVVLDCFASYKYPLEYNKTTGIIKHLSAKESLKPGVADITAAKLHNPHIDFFMKKNPGYPYGDELACLTLINEENLKPVAYRVMGIKEAYSTKSI
ncbi:MAG: hypothetical protein HZB36_00365 [Candidatus Omnitrophica bacterium]|nr:hypothetical protein [Candidatus Omnitrophota bacterium]